MDSYPSGNLAIVISEVARAMHLYTAFDDELAISSKQIAQFDPFGNGYCNFINGDLRYEKMHPHVYQHAADIDATVRHSLALLRTDFN